MNEVEEKPWRKLLWVKQPYPDNYVDVSFLSQLKRNTNVRPYSYWTLTADSSVILLHLTSVALFGETFVGIYNRGWNPGWIVSCSTVLTVAGVVVWDLLNPKGRHDRATTLKSSFLILFTILALSPVLKSLTQSTSSDSIWSLACWLCFANICFHDYSFVPRKEFGPMLSTNLALSAAIVLASRLPTTLSVFCFVLFSIQLFGVFPSFALWVRMTYSKCHWVLLISMIFITDLGLVLLGGGAALVAWVSIQILVCFGLPGWLLALQKYKNEIQGPWDPAKPVLKSQSK
ncbi:hypothetical protein TRICI_002586 [Trichomonascus ciferrii]|uniref:Phosphatidylinositol N-acetylglucosaminyltransferase n=1 Tax=Trichomonascus ciferrii TaxID=44093 RepID=A0A642V689_9ASCO|nr:hypothetical protein TRICI_002586 [Trichomonascus ciferrii]